MISSSGEVYTEDVRSASAHHWVGITDVGPLLRAGVCFNISKEVNLLDITYQLGVSNQKKISEPRTQKTPSNTCHPPDLKIKPTIMLQYIIIYNH